MAKFIVTFFVPDQDVVFLGDPGVGKDQVISRLHCGKISPLKSPLEVVFHRLRNSVNGFGLGIYRIKGGSQPPTVVLQNVKIVCITVAADSEQSVNNVFTYEGGVVAQRCPDAIKVLVVNKTDCTKPVSNASIDNAARTLGIKHVFRVSAKTGEGIEDLRRELLSLGEDAISRAPDTEIMGDDGFEGSEEDETEGSEEDETEGSEEDRAPYEQSVAHSVAITPATEDFSWRKLAIGMMATAVVGVIAYVHKRFRKSFSSDKHNEGMNESSPPIQCKPPKKRRVKKGLIFDWSR